MVNTGYIKSTLKSLEDKADENWWLENVRKNLDVSDKLAPYQMEMDAEYFLTDIPMGRAQGFLDFGTNIIRLDKEYIVIRRNSSNENATIYIVRNTSGSEFKTIKKKRLKSTRDPTFWSHVSKIKRRRKKYDYQLSGYDPSKDIIVKHNIVSGKEDYVANFKTTHSTYLKKLHFDLEHFINDKYNLLNVVIVGFSEDVAVFHDRMSDTLFAYNAKSSQKLWETIPKQEHRYSTIYRNLVISCREEFIIVRDLYTGEELFQTTLDDDAWSYTRPVVIDGSVYIVAQNGYLWRLDFSENTQQLRGPKKEDQPENMINQFFDLWRGNILHGVSTRTAFQFSVVINRCSPIKSKNDWYCYGTMLTQRGILNHMRGKDIRDDELRFSFYRIKNSTLTYPIRFILSRLNGFKRSRFINSLPDPQEMDVLGWHSFAHELQAELFINQAYFQSSKQTSFNETYNLEHAIIKDASSENLPIHLKTMSVQSVFQHIKTSLISSLNVSSNVNFNDVFFSERDKAIKNLKISFDMCSVGIPETEITDRGLAFLDSILSLSKKKAKGLLEDQSFKTMLDTFEVFERAFIYEHLFFYTRSFNRKLINFLKNSYRKSGYGMRSLCYAYLESLCMADDKRYYVNAGDILRSVCQMVIFGKDDVTDNIQSRMNTFGEISFEDYSSINFSYLFGHGQTKPEIVRHLSSYIKWAMRNDRVDDVEVSYLKYHREIIDHLQVIKSEAYKTDYLDSIFTTIPRIIDFFLNKKMIDKSLNINEQFKSLVLMSYLSSQNKTEGRKSSVESINTPSLSQLDKLNIGYGTQEADSKNSSVLVLKNSQIEIEKISLDAPALKGITIVEYHHSKDSGGAFIIAHGAVKYIQLENILNCRSISEMLSAFMNKNTPAIIINRYLGLLYDSLVRPLEHLIEKTDDLTIIPSGFLHSVPFAALFDGSNYLIQKFNIRVNPSISIISQLEEKKSSKNQNVINGLFTLEGDLHYAHEELKYFQSHFSHSFQTIRAKNLSSISGILHISAHAHFNSDEPLKSQISLGSESHISVENIYNHNLSDVNLAVINTCVSRVVKYHENDELFGLARGLISAGCASVINTLWELDDAFAFIFTKSFYPIISESEDSATAFRHTLCQLISADEYSSPYYWACYQYYGL